MSPLTVVIGFALGFVGSVFERPGAGIFGLILVYMGVTVF